MRKIDNKSGFTLIEIIVVLIIVGILAAIALPNLFQNVGKSRSAQAFSLMDGAKTAIESCLTLNSHTAPNVKPCTLAAQNVLVGATNNGFTWTVTIADGRPSPETFTSGATVAPGGTIQNGTATYTLVATDNATAANTITLTRATNGSWTCSTGTNSPYTGVC